MVFTLPPITLKLNMYSKKKVDNPAPATRTSKWLRFPKSQVAPTPTPANPVVSMETPQTMDKSVSSSSMGMRNKVTPMAVIHEGEYEGGQEVEPTMISEASDESKRGSPRKNGQDDVFRFESIVIDNGRSPRNASGMASPRSSDKREDCSGNFIDTFKTLVDITSFGNSDEVRSLSNSTSGSDEEDGNGFSIVEPIRDATYNILNSSSNFIRDISIDNRPFIYGGVNYGPVIRTNSSRASMGSTGSNRTLSRNNSANDSEGSWNIMELAKWL
ncbi:uncharacterized protein BXIN_2348 [Babesia sp. Xinjiang]|uniref:uncharacterized protein n=1 Tax=Babesia sp. Xinjiang TaxID=462227 RepID=UPI000A240D08|nr:uncharacterized protein BXIN_2348 [Babesia sp. Xinjiang]ORM40690.1 hypothetical protein BXIN_2348 [Babesia sp. Xinjiang]